MRNELFEKAEKLLSAWKGNSYIFGSGVLSRHGEIAGLCEKYGKKVLLIGSTAALNETRERFASSLREAGFEIVGTVPGAKPNAPRADVYRIETHILHRKPDLIIAFGGGSTIDASKAANFLACLGADFSPEIDGWFGTGLVSAALNKTGKKLTPLIAVETSAGSAAHLTKYSNITDPVSGQKKLIVDEALVPEAAVFDYDLSASMPAQVIIDGILDTLAHCFEVFCGISEDKFELASCLAETATELCVKYAPRLVQNHGDSEAREALGLASDLGGYAIMTGGTSGAHLTSFSLVDLAAHGTACGIMNPYFAVLFSPAIERQLALVASIYKKYGFFSGNPDSLSGRELGLAAARAMTDFGKAIGAPLTLGELPGFNETYIEKAMEAARDPQLEMKLKNMPIPMSASSLDEYLRPVLMAAVAGDFSLIKTMKPEKYNDKGQGR